MEQLRFTLRASFIPWVMSATTSGARPVVRMAALHIVGIARYSSSLRLALHPTDRAPQAVQLPFLGLCSRCL